MNKLEAQQLIDKHIAAAEASLAEAGKVAEEHGIVIHSGKLFPDVYPGLQYYPKGLPRGEYPWYYVHDEEDRSEAYLDKVAHQYAGKWTTSDSNCS